jgi:hypothetical protein
MKYYLDTEFMEDGHRIELLSLSLVCEDGWELYAINTEADHSHANEFVREHVLPQLRRDDVRPYGPMIEGPPAEIRQAVLTMTQDRAKPRFWGYYADYDWVAFCQLFGSMMGLPKNFPMYCRDLKQLCDELGGPNLPEQGKGEHHALLDARWNKKAHEFLQSYCRATVDIGRAGTPSANPIGIVAKTVSLLCLCALLMGCSNSDNSSWHVRTVPTTPMEREAVARHEKELVAHGILILAGNDQDWDDAINQAHKAAMETCCAPTLWKCRDGRWTGDWMPMPPRPAPSNPRAAR